MNVIYTTCTYNHIGRAFSLADSVNKYSPNTKFLIALVDDHPGWDKEYEVLSAEEMGLPFFKEMCAKYTALELNSALKPYFADYILKKYEDIDILIYLDSDILLFADMDPVYEALKSYSIILTPHLLSTLNSDFTPDDRNFLKAGIYNSGFFAVKNDSFADAFLKWWMGKLRNECYIDPAKGMFAEQLWLNLVPLFFENVHILKHTGCNVAYWNLHERKITISGEKYLVNGIDQLIFFHFSGASIKCFLKNTLSDYQNRYTFTNRPDVIPLFEEYTNSLKKHSFETFNQYYTITGTIKTKSAFIKWVAECYKKAAKNVFYKH